MTWEPRRLPRITPETEAYWEAAGDEKLLLRECTECGLEYHYPRALCPDCLSDDVVWVEANGRGTVYTYTVSQRVEGWPEDALPAIPAFVELIDGPRMSTCLVDCTPEGVSVGMEVEVTFVTSSDHEDVAIPVFSPLE